MVVLEVMQNAQEVLEVGDKDCTSNIFCDVSAKNFDVVCPYPKDLHEAELKINVHSLVEEISGQYNGESLDWLLLITLSQFYNKKKQAGQKEIRSV